LKKDRWLRKQLIKGRYLKRLEINSWNDRKEVKEEAIIHYIFEKFSSNPRRLTLKLMPMATASFPNLKHVTASLALY
jgi:hypothetical protein